MRCVRLALVFVTTVFVVVYSEAQPQQPAPVQTTTLAVVMLNSIDDPIVIADLKLKDEQVKTLVERRKELWDEAYTTSPKKFAETAAARTEATDALLKKTLTEEQYKRAVQLGAQSVLGNRGGKGGGKDDSPTFRLTSVSATTLQRYPELVTAFKLTDDQKKQLTAPLTAPPTKGGKGGGFARSITMTKEQADGAKEFLGPVAKTWQAKRDPRSDDRPFAPANFALLEAKDVRADLKLTDAEAKALAALAEKWQKLADERFTDLSPKEADAQAAVLKTESEKALAALKPEQVNRLKQIAFQTNRSGGFVSRVADTHIDQLYTNIAVAKELTITEAQVKEFQAIQQAFEKDAAAILASADSFTPAEKNLNDLAAARRAKAEAVLTADQTTKLTALVGKPFVGVTRPDRVGGQFGPNTQLTETLRTATFGKYSLLELSLLASNKSIQEELKLDEKQIKKATEAQADIASKTRLPFPGGGDTEAYSKAVSERSKEVEEWLGKLLNEDQAKRFRQLMLQYREKGATTRPGAISTAIVSAVTYPGVAEALKLKDEQKKKLIAGDKPADVLTDAQKSAIKEMLGDPFKGDFLLPRPTGGTPFPRSSALVRLFAENDKVGEEALKLTADQSKKIAAAREAYQKAIQDARPTGPGTNINDYIAALTAANQAFDKAVADVLTADQKPRVAQLGVQYDAAASLVDTLTAPDMVKQLELTKEQTEKLTALGEEAVQLQGLRTTHVRAAADQKLGLQMRDAADDRMMAVLTDAQKKKWKELTGEPLTGLQKTVPGRGFGGPGGPGGGGFGPPPGFSP